MRESWLGPSSGGSWQSASSGEGYERDIDSASAIAVVSIDRDGSAINTAALLSTLLFS